MPRNDEGEFELVLGNSQLLSGFFIVVMLFGIFFSLGYIVGRHSSPAPTITSAASQDFPPAPAASPAGPPPGQAEIVAAETRKTAPAAEVSAPSTGTRPATAPAETPRPSEPP